MSDSGKAVFLSYASQDAEAAKRIAEALRAAGVEVWFDQNELVGGDQWDSKIRGQIASCTLFVPVISANTQARLEGYFRLEWKLAAQRTHTMADEVTFLLPVLVDGTRDAEAKVPAEFRAVQWTKLPGGEATPAFCARVKKLLSGESAVSGQRSEVSGQGTQNLEPKTRNRRLSRWWWIAPIFGMTMALALVLKENRTERIALEPAAKRPGIPLTPARQLATEVWGQLNTPGLSRIELEVADELAKRAAALDPTDAEVIAAGSQVDTWFVYHNLDGTPERKELARRKAAQALQLSPRSFEARLAQACYLVRAVDQVTPESAGPAEALLRDLLRERPDEPRTLEALGTLLERAGSGSAARATFEQLARNPAFAAQAWSNIGWSAMYAGDYKQAEAAADRSITLKPSWSNLSLRAWLTISWRGDPDKAKAAIDRIPTAVMQEDFVISTATWVHWYRRDGAAILRMLKGVSHDWLNSNLLNGPMAAYAAFGHQLLGQKQAEEVQWRAALQVVERRLSTSPNSPNLIGWQGFILLELGQKEEGEKKLRLAEELAGAASQGYGLAIRELLLKHWDEAIAALEVGADQREFQVMPALLRRDPHCDGVRELPRFKALLARLEADPRFDTGEPTTARGLALKPPADEKSVAVLAFTNLSDDKANEYFSDGISEELLTVLQKVPGLKVSARTSSFSFKGREVTAQEIGTKLGVALLVEGSVRRAGGQVRITARLSRTATGEQVWSESYTRDLRDIFAVQTELAQTILAQLQSRLGSGAGQAEIAAQVAAATKGGTRNPEAHELYLQGKYFLGRASLADCVRATGLLQRAVELDPGFALGWATLSSAGWFRGGYGATRQDYEEGYALAKRAADRAIELDPAVSAGWIARFDLQSSTEFDWQGSRESLRRARALAPDDPEVMFRVSALAYTFGDLPGALELTRQAKALDPVNTQVYIQEGYTLLALRRPAEAQNSFQHVLDLSPNAAWGHSGVGLALVAAGQYAQAHEAAAHSTIDWSRLYIQSMARFGMKQRAESDLALAELADRLGEVAAYQIACAHAFRGETDLAFEWLDRAYRQHDPGLSWSKQDFFLQSLHADPRWDAFMHQLGLADDQLK